MDNTWLLVMDFIFISLLIVLAAVIKARVPAIRRLIIPTSMIAGFIGLVVGPELLNWIPFDADMLGAIVYHLMAIGFIALSLKNRDVHSSPAILNSGMLIVSTYLVQGIIGFGILLFLVEFFYPDFFPGIGLLLPLGFGQGPGQAYSIGTQWEELGVTGGGNLGLTIAGIGFIWATVIGIILINILIKSQKFKAPHLDQVSTHKPVVEKSAPDEIPLSDAIDKLTYQIALIGLIYLVTYLTIAGLEVVLTPLGTFGETLAQLTVGFHFLIGSLYAILFRVILNKLQKKGLKLEHSPNNFLLQRIAGFSFDYMITASIAAISIYALREYIVPILLITTIGGLATVLFLVWITPRIFPKDALANTLGFFGMQTGTISTGMALVKAVDPYFQSNTSENLVMGSGTALMFGFPLLIILNVPVVGYVQGDPWMYVYTFFGLLLYFIALLGTLWYRTRKPVS
ncbi:sodium:glutamate symporter [Tenuibacillus multivorans]|uniref:Glutamate:Na+ symporter, ESS family n=1 Tax=Tenuibacillus multivorans TaxID=237069 RepID=A0A1G9WB93_9BACI|nr:sodium:glutamate symporter [Tenuibacillus multivorans]GEL76386.1 sodium:glutamate symporter [Tenuibacillus multivorans]SDM81818.1 glutamate:Na+ symporter, ESS family [Tenuibacillus multivorans]